MKNNIIIYMFIYNQEIFWPSIEIYLILRNALKIENWLSITNFFKAKYGLHWDHPPAEELIKNIKYSGYVSVSAMFVLAFSVIVDYSLVSVESDWRHNATTVGAVSTAGFEFKPIPTPTFDGLFSSLPIFCFAYQGWYWKNANLFFRRKRPAGKQWW